MRYFLLSQSKKLIKPLKIDGLDPNYYKYNISEKDWERIPNMIVAYFHNSQNCEIPAVMKQPTLLISNEMKELFQLYEKSIEFKGVQVFSDNFEERIAHLYWAAKCKEVDCLDESCTVFPNGTIEEIRLAGSRIGDRNIFKIGNSTMNTLVVSFPVAESVLRRNWLGVCFEEIKIC